MPINSTKSTDSKLRGLKAANRQLREFFKIYCNVYDFGQSCFGEIRRPALRCFESHLNARRWQDRLSELPLYAVGDHRAGHSTLHLAPKRSAAARCPSIFVAYRIPLGPDPALAQVQLDWLNHVLHDGLLYHERDNDALYAYALYPLPKEPRSNADKARHLSAARVNSVKHDVEMWLQQSFVQHGWKNGIELLGTYTETRRVEGKLRLVAQRRSQLFRAPRCSEDGSFLQLRLSRFSVKKVPWFWRVAARAMYTVPGPIGGFAPLRESDAVRGAVFQSLRKCFGYEFPRRRMPESEIDLVVHEALETWHKSDEPSPYRALPNEYIDLMIRRLLKQILRKSAGRSAWDPRSLYYGPFDLARAEELIRARISRAVLRALNQEPKLRWCRITYKSLAIALCTIAKNSIINDGFVPTKSVRRTLKFWHISTHGSHVKLLFQALREARLIVCTSAHFEIGVACRQYAVSEAVLSLPFLEHLKSSEVDVTKAAAAPAACAAHLTSRQSSDRGACIGFGADLDSAMNNGHPDDLGSSQETDCVEMAVLQEMLA
jgi:hypothetical protein